MLGYGREEISIMSVFPHGTISVSSLGSFLPVGSSYLLINLLILPYVSLSEHSIFKSISRRRGREKKIIKPHQDKVRREKQRKKIRVKVQVKLVVGF